MTHVQKETAVLLKEKGFDLPCEWVYAYKTKALKSYELTKGVLTNHNWKGDMLISAPDIYTACIWLRAKGVHVSVVPVNLWQQWRMFIYLNSYPPQKTRIPEKPMDFQTHDLALEAGIVHALKNYVK
jgi:hypothetical protein